MDNATALLAILFILAYFIGVMLMLVRLSGKDRIGPVIVIFGMLGVVSVVFADHYDLSARMQDKKTTSYEDSTAIRQYKSKPPEDAVK